MNSLIVVQRRWPDAQCVTGEMLFRGEHRCYTLEPAYGVDTVKPRAIPAGTYDLTIRFSRRFARMMPHVENVPGFSEIMIHWGNFPKDTEGCCIVGDLVEKDFVGHSVAEFNPLFLDINDALKEGPQTVTYLDPDGGPVIFHEEYVET